jgi:hypothetical protein
LKLQGKLVVVMIFLVATLAAVFAIWYRYSQTYRAVQFWGAPTAKLIARAPEAEVLWLGPFEADSVGETLEVDGHRVSVLARQDASDVHVARGILNVRNALGVNASFDWEALDKCSPTWQYAIRLADGTNDVTLLLSLDCPRARRLDRPGEVSVAPIAESLRGFFEERFPESKKE